MPHINHYGFLKVLKMMCEGSKIIIHSHLSLFLIYSIPNYDTSMGISLMVREWDDEGNDCLNILMKIRIEANNSIVWGSNFSYIWHCLNNLYKTLFMDYVVREIHRGYDSFSPF